jgi:hypothetical protein
VGRARIWEKGEYDANFFVHMYVNGKVSPVEIILGMWGAI